MEGDYIQMKIQKILLKLSMQLWEMLKKVLQKLNELKKPYARKVQILTVLEQRAKYGGKPQQSRLAKRAKASLKRKHGTSKKSKKS